MDEFHLEALGTTWTILVDGDVLSSAARQELTSKIQVFEATYSRFKPDSLLSHLNAEPSEKPLPISAELEQMLSFSLRVSKMTQGLFDANVARWESAYGYLANLQFKDPDQVKLAPKGWFEIHDHHLLKHGLVALDLGAFGKGFLIDLLAAVLRQHHLQFFIIDGGRDLWGSSKADGLAWKIALEHPTDTTLAVGVAHLKNQALAASNSFHRRVGKFHHLLNGQTGKPSQELASVFVTAQTAMTADALSTAIFVANPEAWQVLQKHFSFEYVTVAADLQTTQSKSFPGELFLK